MYIIFTKSKFTFTLHLNLDLVKIQLDETRACAAFKVAALQPL